MPPSASYVSFLFPLVLGLLVSGVLSPAVPDTSADDESWGPAAVSDSPSRLYLPAAPNAEISAAEKEIDQLLTKDLVPVEVVPSFVLSPGSRNILSVDENEPGRFFLALPNGTVYFMNRSRKPQWKLLIGQPLSYSWRSPLIDDPQYILYSDHNGELYEYIKHGVVRKHNWTVEEYVQRAPVVKGSVITTGTKSSTFYVVDVDSGELIYSDKEPFSWENVGMRGAKGQSVASKLESGDATYITIIRTDYFLDSYEINNHLWSVMVSRISAYNVGPGLPPTREDEIEITSRSGGNIPVYFPQDSDQASLPKLMLPSAPDAQKMWPGQHEEQPSECESVTNCSIEIAGSSKTDFREILVKLDSRFGSLGRPKGLPAQPTECPSGNCVAAETKFPLTHYSAVSSRPNISYESQNPLNDAVQKNRWLFMQSIYQHYGWLLLPFLLILSVLCYLGLKLSKYNKESSNFKERQSLQSKKRKPRRAGNHRSAGSSDNDKHILSNRGNAEISGPSQVQGSSSYSYINLARPDDGSDGRWVGRLFITNSEIGRGSNGTVVFEGVYDGRPVAVKRLLRAHHDVAFKEIQNLIASDRHPNIVRWYGVEQDLDFVYISLERCICSLGDLIQITSDSSSESISVENPSNSVIGQKVQMHLVKGIGKDVNLWRANGFPSSQLLNLMRDVVSGLAHIHELGIIHRDLKPQNVLISNDKHLNAKLSDMGISKRLLEDMSSLSRNATGYGSSGWQAPEQLLHGRQTRAVDLFSLGCILFFCLTKGKHPFGNHFERDANIINNRMDLFLVNDIPEAEHLLSQLLNPDPQMRPSAVEVLHHPLFWSAETRLSFLRDASDRVELEDRENESDFLKALENHASIAFGGKWNEKLDAPFITDMGRYRKYRFDSVRDLLRVIRNKLNHFRELPRELQEILGPVPQGFDMYFTSRFPKLLVEVYKVLHRHCKEEVSFSKYFQSSQ